MAYEWDAAQTLDYILSELCRNYIDTANSVFKGGYLLRSYLPTFERFTRDIDLSVFTADATHLAETAMREIGENLQRIGQIHSYVTFPVQKGKSGGMQTYRTYGKRGKTIKFVSVDISLAEYRGGLRELTVAGVTCYGYSVERMLADKIAATNSKAQLYRVKDYYDIFAVAHYYKGTVLAQDILDALYARGFYPDRNYVPYCNDIWKRLGIMWNSLKLQETEYGRELTTTATLPDLLKAYENMVIPFFTEIEKNIKVLPHYWDSSKQAWVR